MATLHQIFACVSACFIESNKHTFCSIGNTLYYAHNDKVYRNVTDGWLDTGLRAPVDAVGTLSIDDNSLLVGEGCCCCGGTWRITPDGSIKKILPIEGQSANRDPEGENLEGNVNGFARCGDELLVGTGGCCGKHIYRLTKEDKWEYHPLDPKLYVTAMLGTRGGIYIAMGDQYTKECLFLYDGLQFYCMGNVRGGIPAFIEHQGIVYAASSDYGDGAGGRIYHIVGGGYREVWCGENVRGFFLHNGELYATTHNWRSGTTVLKLQGEKWQIAATFSELLTLHSHDGVLYAAGQKDLTPEEEITLPEEKVRITKTRGTLSKGVIYEVLNSGF